MLSVVADKTGYPAEMLGAHMELEADLGIDSIKRVEILSAIRERAPGLPEVEPTELAAAAHARADRRAHARAAGRPRVASGDRPRQAGSAGAANGRGRAARRPSISKR